MEKKGTVNKCIVCRGPSVLVPGHLSCMGNDPVIVTSVASHSVGGEKCEHGVLFHVETCVACVDKALRGSGGDWRERFDKEFEIDPTSTYTNDRMDIGALKSFIANLVEATEKRVRGKLVVEIEKNLPLGVTTPANNFEEGWTAAIHTDMKECQHDYEHPVRKGRADWRCPKCDKNIMFELLLIHQATHGDGEAKQ